MDVEGGALLNADASATSVEEDAFAQVEVDDVKGIEASVDLTANGDALLNGSAAATTNVSAASTGDDEGSDEATATSGVDNVIGIDAEGEPIFHGVDVTVGGDLEANGSASASQTADADITTGNAVADISGHSVIGAIYDDNLSHIGSDGIDVAGDALVTGDAIVNNDASATSTTGNATASEDVAVTTGLIDDLNVGGDAAVSGSASVTGVASATTVEGVADADSGNKAHRRHRL